MPQKRNSFFFLLIFLILLILHPLWFPWIGNYLVVSDPLQRADALVILAGDENERIAYGAQLYQRGYAEWFLLTDMSLGKPDSEGRYSRVVKYKAIESGVPQERILIVNNPVATTYEEGLEIRDYTLNHDFHSLIVVTSPYHTRRARWILNQVFNGTGIQLIFRPVQDHSYRPEAWWQDPENLNYTTTEYLKLVAHLVGLRHIDQLPFKNRR